MIKRCIRTLISYVNTLVYTKVLSAIYNTQLNPTVSYLNEPGSRRFSLSLDIAEIFKPIIGDRLIFSLLNKNVSYEYLMKLECYKLIKHLLGEKEYEPFKIWW